MAEAETVIARAFDPAAGTAEPPVVGLELEWIVLDGHDPVRPVGASEVLSACAGPLPSGGSVTAEPGGQLELATRPFAGAAAALEAARRDEDALARRAAAAGLALVAVGVDPYRPPVRSLDTPRYRCMEAAFDVLGPEGRAMMCSTASLQVNLAFGADPLATWRRAALCAPVLAAAFANAPFRAGRRDGPGSARARIWSRVDPGRSAPVPCSSVGGWQAYSLDADVLYVRRGEDAVTVAPGFTLRDWVRSGHPAGWPDDRDVAEHLTTLFPPIRPRTWLECRFLDAIGAEDRWAAVTVLVALASDATPLDALEEACGPPGDPWQAASGRDAHPDPATLDACLDLASRVASAADPAGAAGIRRWRARVAAGERAPGTRTLAALSCAAHAPCPDRAATMAVRPDDRRA